MSFLLENLLLLGIVGAVLVLASFMRPRFVKPTWWALLAGCATLVVVGAAAAYVAFYSTPDGGDTVVVDPTDPLDPADEIEVTPLLDRLTEFWDSEKREADWPVAETLAVLSDTAYLAPYDADAAYKRLGFETVVPIVSQSMIGYIVINKNSTVICFRGTDFTEVADWIANLDRSSTDVQHGKIHRGFYNAYLSLKPQIEAVLADYPTEHLWITGHSLGGALALVCAYDFMEYEERGFDGLITFGQPKVARRELADYLDSALIGRYARIVNGDDLVPRIPPSHVYCGSLVWFNGDQLERSKPKRVLYGSADGPARAAAIGDGVELPEMNEQEFAALQQELQSNAAEPDEPPVAMQAPGDEAMYAGPSRIIEDHSMGLYIDEIRIHLGYTNSP